MQETMLENIILDLAENYRGDDPTLANLLDRVIADALTISNRILSEANIEILQSEIIETTKSLYLQRGSEDTESRSESGLSSNYRKAIKEMRENIIFNGKRVVF